MKLKAIFLFIFTAIFFQSAVSTAEMLNIGTKSPYGVLKAADAKERMAIVDGFERLAKDSSWSRAEAEALVALVSEDAEISGDEVLEALDQDILNWFYGFAKEEKSLLHNASLISRTPDEGQCKRFTLCVVVSISKQRIYAYYNGSPLRGVHDNPVSSARAGKVTPLGIFSVDEIAGVNRRSNLYKGAYMGYAMQFHGNYFIHATSTDQYPKLGSKASAGCVRVRLEVAEKLNSTMRQVGRSNIRVVVKN